MATQTAIHPCPQCGDDMGADAIICAACYAGRQRTNEERQAAQVCQAFAGWLSWPVCVNLVREGVMAK